MNTELIDLCIAERNPDEMDFALNEGYYEEIKQYAQKLGLQGQIDVADEYLRKLRRPKVLTPCLSAQELLIWQEFLPTSYRGTPSKPVVGSIWLNSYRFDLIPKHIHEQWVEWNSQNVFDEFKVRTEEESLDPALFGIRDGRFWLLARWGAADETLASFAEIKALLRERLRIDRRDMAIVASLFISVPLGCLWPIMKAVLGKGPPDSLGLLFPALLGMFAAWACREVLPKETWAAVNKR